jgi:hypothetical protein
MKRRNKRTILVVGTLLLLVAVWLAARQDTAPKHASALEESTEVAQRIEALPRYVVTNDRDSRA